MKTPIIAATLLMFASLAGANAQIHLSQGHVDIGIGYKNDDFDLHIHDEENDVEYEPNEAVFDVLTASQTTIPNDPNFAFLGNGGDPVWILPQTEQPGQLFLGFGTEEIPDGTLMNNELTIRLTGLVGPAGGAFSVYRSGVTPEIVFDSGDGFSAADSLVFATGSHDHFNWAFNAQGNYQVTFEVSGNLPNTTPVSKSATYAFAVVPEPSTYGIALGAALVALVVVHRLKRRRQGVI